MLEQHAHSSHLEAQMRLAGVIGLGIKESFSDGVSADGVSVHALAESLVALLRDNREVKMSFEVGRLLLQIFQLFFQISSDNAGNPTLGNSPLVEPILRDLLIRRLLQEAFTKLVEPAPRDPQILAGFGGGYLPAHEVRENLPRRLPA